jgi:hypothetical protein
MAKPNLFLALSAAAMASQLLRHHSLLKRLSVLKQQPIKIVVVPPALQIEVETYQTPKKTLSLLHILFQITAQNLIQS